MPENRIIKVKYSPDGYTKTRAAYQYDYGQVLRLEGFPEGMLPDPFEVHFSVGSGLAKTQIGTDSAVSVLDECLERYGTIAAWLFLHDTASDGETKYTIEIPVRSRSKTVDASPTPVQQSAITQAIAALQTGVSAAETAQGKAEDAQAAAEEAQGKAEDAQEAAETAQQAAENAAETAAEDARRAAEDVLTGKADKTDTVLDTTLSRGRKANTIIGIGSIAFGNDNTASNRYSVAFGEQSAASGADSYAHGVAAAVGTTTRYTTASGSGSHAEGGGTLASGGTSHAEGVFTTASGDGSHAEGFQTTASGMRSHSEGEATEASGRSSHSEGVFTIANHKSQHVSGEYNIADQSAAASNKRGTYVEIVGNGTADNARSNARTLDWSGNEELAGDLKVNAGTANEASISNLAKEVKSKQDALRVTSLTQIPVASGQIVDSVGIPVYVDDVSEYAGYGITDTGWYTFVRITAKEGVTVSAQTTVTGADGYIATIGADHVDVAVRFGVAAQSKTVTVAWGNNKTETFVFRATDLAVRNLDYRVTFYIYDIADFAAWTWALTTDTTFAADKNYFTLANNTYTQAEVTASDPVPAYYTLADETYTQATGLFEDGVTYYTKSGDTYTEAEVTVGDPIPAYYNHTKLTFSGMIRNVTYRFNEMVDCPIEIVLPEVPDDGYGAWFEIQMQYSKQVSTTLLPTDNTVVIGTAQTQAQTAGINVIDLQYSDVNDVKMWTLLNTHSNLPTSGGT